MKGSPDPPLPYRTERVLPGVQFEQPVAIVSLPGRDRLLVLERNGKLFTLRHQADAERVDLAGDVKTWEPDLAAALDVTLDPDFEDNGFVYLVWKAKPWFTDDGARVVRYRLTDDKAPKLDLDSRLDIFSWPSGDHAGSTLRFGPDGMLYVTMGDGSGPFPPDILRTGQNLSDVRGSILRLDVRGATEDQRYRIPADNPFVKTADARGEIFAFGFRNPWRMDFDPGTGALYVGDVGWELWEMIHHVRSGGNHGWSITEGPQPIYPDDPFGPGQIVAPEIALPHTESQSITGGLAVRGFGPESLEGHYVCGDYVSGSIWAAKIEQGKLVDNQKIAVTPLAVITFAKIDVDDDGRQDLIVLDFGGGVHRLVENTRPDSGKDFPRRLSRTGLFESLETGQPAAGVTAYRPAATMWRDGATGNRLLAVPGDETIGVIRNRRRWTAPEGTVLANTLSREVQTAAGDFATKRIETQILLFDGIAWQPYTYRWRADESDADLVDADGDSLELTVADDRFGSRVMRHTFASRDQCRVCHHQNVPVGISLTPENLQTPWDAESKLRNGEPAVTTWQAMVDRRLVSDVDDRGQPLVDPHDVSQPLESRARSYLSANCAHCHMRGGGGSAAVVLSHTAKPDDMNAVDAAAGQGNFGIPGVHDGDAASVIHAGDPSRSVLYYRMSTILSGRMPHAGSREVDVAGLRLVGDWIASLPSRPGQPSSTELHLGRSDTVFALSRQREWLELPAEERSRRALETLADEPSTVVRGLIEAFVPPDLRSERIGPNPDVARLLALTGDAQRGQKWFAGSASSQCRSCHVAAGVGMQVGPELSGIAKRMTRQQLLESLLEPSKKIDEAWASYTVLTVDGRQFVGLKIAEDDSAVTLRTAAGNTIVIEQDEIEEIFRAKVSLMPTGLVETMTEAELGDLLAFLQSL